MKQGEKIQIDMTNAIPQYHTRYEDIWYRYNSELDFWELSDDEYDMGWKFVYKASIYRIDECLEKFKAFMESEEYKFGNMN